jgi:hypothetical protein
MKSETITIQQLFQDRRQYCVPFYQRRYVWTLDDQWEQLWEDVRAKAEARVDKQKPTPHFLGAVVLDPQEREGLIGVDVLHIIDGQQRLTTLQFLLTGLQFALHECGITAFITTIKPCTTNGNTDTMRDPAVEVYKVWPTFEDRAAFRSAVDAGSADALKVRFSVNFTGAGDLRKYGDHPPALAAIWHFTRWFRTWIGTDADYKVSRAEALVSAVLRDLKLVTIVLEKEDDAQVIFETLNGRGARLHATDLIRNFLFMRADREGADSEELYETLWAPFESSYWSEEQRRGRMRKPRLEWFIHASLQAERQEEIDLGRLYYEYRQFAADAPAEQQLRLLSEYATHYQHLLTARDDTPIGRFGRRIAPYDITTLHPLALFVARSGLPDAQKDEMYGDLISFVVRRAVCGLGSKNYNNVFLTTLKQLKTAGASPQGMRAILSAHTGSASRWPSDSEFRAACTTARLYDDRLEAHVMRGILTELEAQLRREANPEEPGLPNLAQLDIDHILPKSWHAHWALQDGSQVTPEEIQEVRIRKMAGEPLSEHQELIARRSDLIQTLGNLTLLNLSVNRGAQHQAFPVKRDLLIANTALRLNVPLVAMTGWDEDKITTRGDLLSGLALAIWPGPRS